MEIIVGINYTVSLESQSQIINFVQLSCESINLSGYRHFQDETNCGFSRLKFFKTLLKMTL